MYKIISPATSANMGAGFDCLGICLSESNIFVFDEWEDAIVLNGHADTLRNRDNLAVRAYFEALQIIGAKIPSGVKIDIKTVVPLARGLGSSSTCISAAVAAAFMLDGKNPSKEDIFEISAIIEGHPDNVGPCIFGGCTLSYVNEGKNKCVKFKVDEKYKFVALIPDFQLSTQKSREVLPDKYSREDAVFNMSRLAITMNALQSGNSELLREGLEDRLHQPYRKQLIDDFDDILCYANDVGVVGTYLSGAGPTIMSIIDDDSIFRKINATFQERFPHWKAELLEVNYEGLECFKMK